MINQKNYYTEYLKREEQYLAFRAPQEEATARMVQAARDKDRARAMGEPAEGEADEEEDEDKDEESSPSSMQADPNKLVVLHCGSQNLRVGLGADALPKTVPMVIARRWKEAECEENGGEPCPKRQKVDGAVPASALPEKWFGEDVRLSLLPVHDIVADLCLVRKQVQRHVLRTPHAHAIEQEARPPKQQRASLQLQPASRARGHFGAQRHEPNRVDKGRLEAPARVRHRIRSPANTRVLGAQIQTLLADTERHLQ